VAKGRRAARTTRAPRVRSRAAAVAASPAEGQAKSAAPTAPAPARTSAAPVGRVNSAEEPVSLAASAGNATIQRTSAGLTTRAFSAADPDRRVALTIPAPTGVAAIRTVPSAWHRARHVLQPRAPVITALAEPVEGLVHLVVTTVSIALRRGASAKTWSVPNAVEPVSLAVQERLLIPAWRASPAVPATSVTRQTRAQSAASVVQAREARIGPPRTNVAVGNRERPIGFSWLARSR